MINRSVLVGCALALLVGCAGGGSSSSPVAPAVHWAQASYTMGGTSTWNQMGSVNVTNAPPVLAINLVDVDAAIPGGPTHTNNSVFNGSNGVVNIPFYRGTATGTWRFRAELVVGATTYSDTVSIVVQ
jgi:hypothetical protein